MRIEGVDPATVEPDLAAIFKTQEETWGEMLGPYLLYARRPSVFRSVRGMWDGLKASALLEPALKALLNRRVAALNGCAF